MEFIELNGRRVLLNIVNHDSGEEPESACVNRMISIKLGEKTYHKLATDPRELSAMVRQVVADAQLRNVALPDMLTSKANARKFPATLARMAPGAFRSNPKEKTMKTNTHAPTPYEIGCLSVRLWDEQSAGEGLDVANDFHMRFGHDAAARAEFNRGVEEEKVRRNLTD